MIKVAIVEDNNAFRKALEVLINAEPEIDLVFSSAAIPLFDEIKIAEPHVCILDIEMPGMNGIEGVRHLKKHLPDTSFLMLTVFDDDENIFESIKAGAVGYLLKKDPPQMIIDAIKQIHNGGTVMNGKIARKVLEFFAQKESKKDIEKNKLDAYKLTKRETEVLELLMTGLTYKEIAARCFISIDTMYTHTRNIYSKLNVHSRAEIAARLR